MEALDALLSHSLTALKVSDPGTVSKAGELKFSGVEGRAFTPGYIQPEFRGVFLGVIDHQSAVFSAIIKHQGPGLVQLW